MKITVLNGSPKGKYSITLQTIYYLEKCFPQDTFEIFHVGQQIRSFEKEVKMSPCMESMLSSDLILFSYPVYTFLAPYQLHRFIELIKAHPRVKELKGKCMTQFTTSKHFYDVTAHAYIEENSHDLGMYTLKGLSADMDDMLTAKGQDEARSFWKLMQYAYQHNGFSKPQLRQKRELPTYRPVFKHAGGDEGQKGDNFDTLILTNVREKDTSLQAMIDDFKAVYPYRTRVINLNDFAFQGGCLGCFGCAADAKCVYKDGFDTYLREQIQNADAIVYAATIQDHYLGTVFKCYDDRQFCNGHRTVTVGMPIAYLLSGNYQVESNLKQVIEGRSQVGHQFLAGVVADDLGEGQVITEALQRVSGMLDYALQHKVLLPQNFYGIGGMKIFRDLIYVMRGMMKADHQFYKANGMYDFPQKKWGMRLKIQMVGLLINTPAIKKHIGSKMNEGMIAPYRKVIDQVERTDRMVKVEKEAPILYDKSS